jgi:hypothetical protein
VAERNLTHSLDCKIAILEQKKQAIDSLLTRLKEMRDELVHLPKDIAAILENDVNRNGSDASASQSPSGIAKGSGESKPQPTQVSGEDESKERMPTSPSAAVFHFIKHHPGAKAGHVAAMLEHIINTKSDQPKTIIYNTIGYLIKRGQVAKEPLGGLFVIPRKQGAPSH